MTQQQVISWLGTLYPETIMPDRYSGIYSGGLYLAFPLRGEGVPAGASASDVACASFWSYYTQPVGKGSSPQSAHDDLIEKMRALLPDKKVEILQPESIVELRPEYTFSADRIWFTADTHFCHENIVRFSGRPFKNATEMNEEIIRRWNETVPEDGTVFHLGDFCLGGSKDWNNIMRRLHGMIYLILGNHDFRNIKQPFMSLFEMVTQQMTIRVGGQSIILNHNPFLCYGGSYRDKWQLFGHVHSGPLSTTGLDLPRLKMLFPRQYDVGMDNNDFRPVSFAEVKAKIEAQVQAARRATRLLK